MEADVDNEKSLDLQQIAKVTDFVVTFVSNNKLPAAELPNLVRSIHQAFFSMEASQSAAADRQLPTPSQIRRSITPDALISFIDGKPYKTLKRHLRKHGLDPQGYRDRYGLPRDYPLVAAGYSELRAAYAKTTGLGRNRRRRSGAQASGQT